MKLAMTKDGRVAIKERTHTGCLRLIAVTPVPATKDNVRSILSTLDLPFGTPDAIARRRELVGRAVNTL